MLTGDRRQTSAILNLGRPRSNGGEKSEQFTVFWNPNQTALRGAVLSGFILFVA